MSHTLNKGKIKLEEPTKGNEGRASLKEDELQDKREAKGMLEHNTV